MLRLIDSGYYPDGKKYMLIDCGNYYAIMHQVYMEIFKKVYVGSKSGCKNFIAKTRCQLAN